MFPIRDVELLLEPGLARHGGGHRVGAGVDPLGKLGRGRSQALAVDADRRLRVLHVFGQRQLDPNRRDAPADLCRCAPTLREAGVN